MTLQSTSLLFNMDIDQAKNAFERISITVGTGPPLTKVTVQETLLFYNKCKKYHEVISEHGC